MDAPTRLQLIIGSGAIFFAFGVWVGTRLKAWYVGYTASSMIIVPPTVLLAPMSKGVTQMGEGPSGNFRSVVEHDPPLPGTMS